MGPPVGLASLNMARYRKPRRFRPESPPPAHLGSEAFGNDPEGRPTGSAAFGESDEEFPLRGALTFGNDAKGRPLGSEMIGADTDDAPLRGALLFGNDAQGAPRGSEAFGGDDASIPLRGALLFGNDPAGAPRGSESFGAGTERFPHVGSAALGAPQLLPEKLSRDPIGYDFKGRLLRADDSSFAGIRRDPLDRIRERIVAILSRNCAIRVDDLRHGLNEDAIPWGRLRRDPELDGELARTLRRWWRKAPGEVLGICHVWEVLEDTQRMHTFELSSVADRAPRLYEVRWDDEVVARAVATLHKEHRFYTLKDADHRLLGYLDQLLPHRRDQVARLRSPAGESVGHFVLRSESGDDPSAPTLVGTMFDANRSPLFRLLEKRSAEHIFLGEFFEPHSETPLGGIEDRLKERGVDTLVELDVKTPRSLAWAVAIVMADLARFRRAGWPQEPLEVEESYESIEAALGPSSLARARSSEQKP